MGVRAPQCLLVVLLVAAVIFVFFSRNYRVKISEVRRVRAGLPRVRGLCLVGSGPVRSGPCSGIWHYVDDTAELGRSTTVFYRRDRQALSRARFCRAGQLAIADSCIRGSILAPPSEYGGTMTCELRLYGKLF